MMIVPTFVGPSPIEGVGVFAAEPIVAGTQLWALDDSLDLLVPDALLASMPALQRDFIERYGYPHMTKSGLTVLEFDNGRFMNHCASPNTDFSDPEAGWAIRDIAQGEEIVCDYGEFDPSFVMQPGRRFATAGLLAQPVAEAATLPAD